MLVFIVGWRKWSEYLEEKEKDINLFQVKLLFPNSIVRHFFQILIYMLNHWLVSVYRIQPQKLLLVMSKASRTTLGEFYVEISNC